MQTRAVPLAECLPAALEFRNANRAAARDDSYISWRYLSRPSQQATFVVWLEEGGARVAAATVAPHHFVVGGEARRIGIVGDISVAASARGRGLARPLLEGVVSESAGTLDGLLVMPNPPVFSALRSAGWREVAGLPRHVRFVGAGPAGAGGARGAARRLARAALAGSMSMLDVFRNVSIPSGYRLDVQTTLPPDYATFWEETSRSHALIGSRAPEYLEWRYLRHPIYRYTFLVLTGPGGTQGYAMTRQDGADVWVDDWFVKDQHAGAALGAALLAWVHQGSSAATLQTRTADTTAATIPWKRLGFLQRSDTQAVFVAGAWRDQAAERAPAWLLTPGDKDV